MAEYKVAEKVPIDVTTSPICSHSDTTLDEKADTELHQKAVNEHTKALVDQDGGIDLSVEIQTPSVQNPTEPAFLSKNSLTSSLDMYDLSMPDLSHTFQNSDCIPSQLNVQNASDGIANITKEVEVLPSKLHVGCNADEPENQTNTTQFIDVSTARAGSKPASLPSEMYYGALVSDTGDALMGIKETISSQINNGSPAGIPDSQTSRTSNVDEIWNGEDIPLHKINDHSQHNHMGAHKMKVKTSESAVSPEQVKKDIEYRSYVDTTAPFESVKEAVTKFGGIVDWKAHKALTIEKRRLFRYELEKVQEELPVYSKKSKETEAAKAEILKELDTTRRLVEELKLNLERAQIEEAQAKQDAELAQLRAREVEDGISDDISVAAKTQLKVATARHEAAVSELKSVKEELLALQAHFSSSVSETEIAIKRAEEAVSVSKEMEKAVEDLTLELISTKESLEAAHAAHIEAEEHRIGAALAKDQDCHNWDKEVKQAEEELNLLNEQLLQAKKLEENLKTASTLLANLKEELSVYMESKLKEQLEILEENELKNEADEWKKSQLALASKRKQLEEVKSNMEKAKVEVGILRVAESALKSELEKEISDLASLRQREGMASITVSSLEAEIERTNEEIKQAMEKEKEARLKMVELPKLLQLAALEADQSKSSAKMAREELRKVSEEAEQAKATLSTTEIRLQASLKEIEAAKASERLAVAAVRALKESEEAAAMGESPRGVTLSLEEYYSLSKKAHEAEEFANERITTAIAQIQVAKESELKGLRRLEEAHVELNLRKEALRLAAEKAEKAKEGKLWVEQELRKWRAEHELRRKATDTYPPKTPTRTSEESSVPVPVPVVVPAAADIIHPSPGPLVYVPGKKKEHVIPEFKPRKKSFFPRIVMFLVRRRSQSRK